ncbi:hypothetical protein [Glutamicibacter arilaitensis]|uniref:hypothetical protein n=1 Tax=Glutamicibacter arilaitensis TaxID=256701 RepID=UPI003A931AA5
MENSQVPDGAKAPPAPLEPQPEPSNPFQNAGQNPQVKKFTNAVLELKSRASLQLLGFQAGSIAAIGIVLALCYLIPFASLAKEGGASSYDDFNVASQLNSFKAFIMIFGAVLGGGLKVAGAGGAFNMYGEMSLVLAFVSVTFIVAICAANYAIVRKLTRGVRKGGWKSAALASGLHALVLALVFLIISLFGKLSFEGGEMISASISPRYAGVFFTIALAVFFSQFLATAPQRANAGSAWLNGVREAVLLAVSTLIAFALVGVVTAFIQRPDDMPWSMSLILLPLLGTIGSYVGALGFFGALAPNVSGMASFIGDYAGEFMPESVLRFWDIAEGKGAWLLVLTVVLVLLVAIRVGVHRGRLASGVNMQRAWQLPVAALVLWMVLSWLTNISMGGTVTANEMGEMSGSMSFGITWYSVIFLALGAAVVSLLAEVLPLQVYRYAPSLLALLAGKDAAARWVSGQPAPVAPVSPAAAVPTETAPVAKAEPAPAGPAPALAPASAESKKKAKAVGFSVLALAAIVGIGIGTVAYLNSQRKPEAEVEKYLSLLAEGKADKATEMVDPGIDNASRVLLTDEVLGSAEQRLELLDVVEESRDDNGALVRASYAINGERHERGFTVNAGEKEFGLLDTWVLNESLIVPVQISADQAQEVAVGKSTVKLASNEDYYGDETSFIGDFYAYPGIYNVSAPGNEYRKSEPQELRVNHPESQLAQVALTTTTTEKLNELVLEEVKKFAKACVTVPTNLEDGCPSSLQSKDLESFSVKSHADSVEIDESGQFSSSDIVFKYKRNDSEYMDYDEEEITRSFTGSVDWYGEKPQVTVEGASWW